MLYNPTYVYATYATSPIGDDTRYEALHEIDVLVSSTDDEGIDFSYDELKCSSDACSLPENFEF